MLRSSAHRFLRFASAGVHAGRRHPEHEIGFAFVPTALHVLDILNERGKAYQAEVVRCVERLRG